MKLQKSERRRIQESRKHDYPDTEALIIKDDEVARNENYHTGLSLIVKIQLYALSFFL